MKVISIILVAFLLAIQAQLWLGKGGLPRGVHLRAVLTQTQAENEQARVRNAQLEAELRDLREGLEMVEEKARFELGMIKPDEIFVQVRR
ncbi:septum formation initiator family protein [Paucibacter sp. B2R-40]|uniref:septum formation initiator family protein n=1 Tax=Paucibacter sp. B2R-40 TaxID=2893554 RepID=UPI0021E407E2|nr:septum formation initiator family protein [Paucibacter sp. B2R-40]MCV2355752.1 septum formation initiator family protein [Paucibacter sp. B2R-40]